MFCHGIFVAIVFKSGFAILFDQLSLNQLIVSGDVDAWGGKVNAILSGQILQAEDAAFAVERALGLCRARGEQLAGEVIHAPLDALYIGVDAVFGGTGGEGLDFKPLKRSRRHGRLIFFGENALAAGGRRHAHDVLARREVGEGAVQTGVEDLQELPVAFAQQFVLEYGVDGVVLLVNDAAVGFVARGGGNQYAPLDLLIGREGAVMLLRGLTRRIPLHLVVAHLEVGERDHGGFARERIGAHRGVAALFAHYQGDVFQALAFDIRHLQRGGGMQTAAVAVAGEVGHDAKLTQVLPVIVDRALHALAAGQLEGDGVLHRRGGQQEFGGGGAGELRHGEGAVGEDERGVVQLCAMGIVVCGGALDTELDHRLGVAELGVRADHFEGQVGLDPSLQRRIGGGHRMGGHLVRVIVEGHLVVLIGLVLETVFGLSEREMLGLHHLSVLQQAHLEWAVEGIAAQHHAMELGGVVDGRFRKGEGHVLFRHVEKGGEGLSVGGFGHQLVAALMRGLDGDFALGHALLDDGGEERELGRTIGGDGVRDGTRGRNARQADLHQSGHAGIGRTLHLYRRSGRRAPDLRLGHHLGAVGLFEGRDPIGAQPQPGEGVGEVGGDGRVALQHGGGIGNGGQTVGQLRHTGDFRRFDLDGADGAGRRASGNGGNARGGEEETEGRHRHRGAKEEMVVLPIRTARHRTGGFGLGLHDIVAQGEVEEGDPAIRLCGVFFCQGRVQVVAPIEFEGGFGAAGRAGDARLHTAARPRRGSRGGGLGEQEKRFGLLNRDVPGVEGEHACVAPTGSGGAHKEGLAVERRGQFLAHRGAGRRRLDGGKPGAFGAGAEGVGEMAHPDDVVAIAHRDAAREVAIDIGLHEAVAEIALRERGATLRGYAKTAPTAQQDAKQSEKTAMKEGGCFHLKTENELKLGDGMMRPHGGVL